MSWSMTRPLADSILAQTSAFSIVKGVYIIFIPPIIVKKTRQIKVLSFLTILVGVLLILLFMKRQGFFKDPAIALRELKKLEIPATPERVREAAQKGEAQILSALGRAEVDFLESDEAGKNALHLALHADQREILPIIEQYGMSVNQSDKGGLVPMWYALEKEDSGLATWLVERGAEVDFQVGPEVAVVNYYDSNRWEDFGFLLDHGAEVNVTGTDREPLLGRAIRDGKTPWVQRLLHAGADANVSSAHGEPLVAKALEMGRSDLVIELLEAGANPNTRTQLGEPLLLDTILRWEQIGLDEVQAEAVVASLIKNQADLESPHLGGLRPLQAAILKKFSGAQKLLLPKVRSVEGCLGLAMRSENYEIMHGLLERGADPNEMVNGEPILFPMIKMGQVAVVDQLISSGASLEVLGLQGQRPLVTALAAGQPEVALAMLTHERKPQLDAHMEFPVSESFRDLFSRKGLFDWYCRNERELQAIHVAVMRRQLPVVKQLLALGADKFASTKNKVFPIQMAAANADIKMQQLLIGVPYEDDQQERNFIIDLSEQKVYYYKGGKVMKTSRISSGQKGFRTPTGNYVITDKTKNKVSNIYRDADMPYFQRFSCSPIGFHEGYTGSRYASHGCIRLPMSVAKYFWGQTKIGDRVTIRK